MAAPHLRIVRTPRASSPMARRSLVAASQPITEPSAAFKKSAFSSDTGSKWQDDAWDFLSVGELAYYVQWRSASASRVRLVASDLDEETGLPTGGTENKRVQEIVRAIARGPLGQSQLIKRATECLTVPGETWIVMLVRKEGEVWLALTRDEVKVKNRQTEIELPSGDKHIFRKGTDIMFRVWNPDPKRAKLATSPVKGALTPLREIVRTTKTIDNASKSRLIGNGVVFVPQEMSLPAPDAPRPEGTAAIAPAQANVQQLQDMIADIAQTAYGDEDSLASLVPIIAGVPGDRIKDVKHLRFDNNVTEVALKTRTDAIKRLAMSLDVNPERLLGMSEGNHWSAWLINDDDVRLHIVPPVETLCQALTENVLRFMLESEGIDPDQYVVWYDPAALTVDPDQSDEGTAAYDRGVITAEAYRGYLGLGEDAAYDLATEKGIAQWAFDRISANPELITTYAPLLGSLVPAAAELQPAAPAIEPAQQPVDAEEPGADSTPGSEPDTEGESQQKAALTPTELAVSRVMVNRALELAGKRARTRADHDRLRDVPMHETYKYMPPVNAADVIQLTRGWDDSLDNATLEAMQLDGVKLRRFVNRTVRETMVNGVVDGDVS